MDYHLVCYHFLYIVEQDRNCDTSRLIVAACLVEAVSPSPLSKRYQFDSKLFAFQGEVLARLVVHATKETIKVPDVATVANMTGDQAIQVLQQLALAKRITQ